MQFALRSFLRHSVQRAPGGRSVRMRAPLLTGVAGYPEQLRHQCHLSL
jgi:hypothetical protein